MDISRRLVVCAVALAVAAGFTVPALLARADDPDLAPPLRLRTVETDPSPSPPAAPRDPVPVLPRNDRADDAVRGGDDDDDGPGTEADDDEPDGNGDGPRDRDSREATDGAGNDRSDDASHDASSGSAD